MINNIVLISDPRVLEIKIIENNNPLVDARQCGILVDDRKSNDSDSFFYIRKIILDKLLMAQNLLPANIKIKLIEGLRSIDLQKTYFDSYVQELREKHPNWNEEKIYKEASQFVSPPEIVPPHCTGGAIDITLVNKNDKELDMGTEVNVSPQESQEACFTEAINISDLAKKNRKILVNCMEKADFVNYPTEWWHWSYGDKYWAFISKNPHAHFNIIK